MLALPFTRIDHLAVAAEAVRKALAGHAVVAIPTETFYGLAVDPEDALAVRRVYDLKGRPGEKALPVVGGSLAQLASLVVFPAPWAQRLRAAWPGPLTVVVPARRRIAAGDATLAVRVPGHTLLRRLLASVGPLTATSANRSGHPPTTDPREVTEVFAGGVALLLDGGRTPGGAPSTVLDLTGSAPRVLRAGGWKVPPGWGVEAG
jgi:L-threonylcarbamoyladenylate synthase